MYCVYIYMYIRCAYDVTLLYQYLIINIKKKILYVIILLYQYIQYLVGGFNLPL